MGKEERRRIFIGHANTWHDPALALSEGDRLYAEAIERHTRCKRALEMPKLWYSWRALRAFLEEAGSWPLENADVVSLSSWSGPPPGQVMERAADNPIPAMLAASTLTEPIFNNQLAWAMAGYPPRIFRPGDQPGVDLPGTVQWMSQGVTHQVAHAATAVYTSPFEECVVMVIDGYSEGTALSFFHYTGDDFELLHQEDPGVSLGLLYAAVTQFCGFDPYQGEEWKVMGLAAYGQHRDELHDFFAERLVVDGLSLSYRAPGGRGKAFDSGAWEELERRAGGFRQPGDPDVLAAADLAHNFQACFEETVVALARNASRLGLSTNLAFAGGCALNSATNGALVDRTGFERLHVPCAPGDDGNALGVVLHGRYTVLGEPRVPEVMSPYLGSSLDPEVVRETLELGGARYRVAADDDELCREVAKMLADGELVAWVQGRAEFGPRALGNRSILADPRSADMKDRINSRVKFREPYRPFAPSILEAAGPEWFDDYQPSPYMERTRTFRQEVRDRVPAVVHEDGTGRLQSVGDDWNPLFAGLLRAFEEEAGVPVLLNTSFNVMGRPIVHDIQDCLATFHGTGLDRLVIGRHIVSK